jgi:hypothetical protein
MYKQTKSEILPIGIGTISDTEKIRYGLTICEKEILLLGVYIGKDQIVKKGKKFQKFQNFKILQNKQLFLATCILPDRYL